MTLFDLAAVLIVLVYVVIGYYSGVIRRVIGLAGAFLGCLVGTYMGVSGGSIVQQYWPDTPIPDSRIYSWLFFFALIVLIIEGAALAVHDLLQVSVVLLNRFTGVLVGLVTAGVVVVALAYMLAGYAQPLGSGPVDSQQIKVRDAVANSKIGLSLAKLASPVLIVMEGALPHDPATYFGAPTPKS